MKLQELFDQAELDLKINPDRLDKESIETPMKIARWLQWSSRASYEYKTLLRKFYKLKAEKYDHYKFDHAFSPDKSEMAMLLESDDDLQDIEAQVDVQKEKIDFIEQTVKTLQQRTFHIKNAIDYRKFMSGS